MQFKPPPVAQRRSQQPAKQFKLPQLTGPVDEKPARQFRSPHAFASAAPQHVVVPEQPQPAIMQREAAPTRPLEISYGQHLVEPASQQEHAEALRITHSRDMPYQGKHAAQPVRPILQLIAITLVSIAVSFNFSNYSSIIPLLQSILRANKGEIGLFSTLLFLGLSLTTIPGGVLSDRYGSRATMLGSLVLVTLGAFLFPLYPHFIWMILCRALIGLGSGAALVAASHATAELGKYSAFGQGLNGGAAQLGTCLGIFITPLLLGPLGWQQALVIAVIPGVLSFMIWCWMPVPSQDKARAGAQMHNLRASIQSPVIWSLAFTNMGTFGLGNTITAWLTLYFLSRHNIPLGLAAALGSLGVFLGIFFRPLGGILLARWQHPTLFMRTGTVLTFIGLGLLALPIVSLPLAIIGVILFSFGVTLPYAAIFSTAAIFGKKTHLGSGVAQGLSAVLSAPAAIVCTPLIGLIEEQSGSFSIAFGSVGLLIAAIGIIAAFLFAPALDKHNTSTRLRAVTL